MSSNENGIPRDHAKIIASHGYDPEVISWEIAQIDEDPRIDSSEDGWGRFNGILKDAVGGLDQTFIDHARDVGKGINRVKQETEDLDKAELDENSRRKYESIEEELEDIENLHSYVYNNYYWEEGDTWLKSFMVDDLLTKEPEEARQMAQKYEESYARLEEMAQELEDLSKQDEGNGGTGKTEPEPVPTTPGGYTPDQDDGDENGYDKPSDTLEWLGGVAFGDYGLGDFTLGLRGEKRGP